MQIHQEVLQRENGTETWGTNTFYEGTCWRFSDIFKGMPRDVVTFSKVTGKRRNLISGVQGGNKMK